MRRALLLSLSIALGSICPSLANAAEDSGNHDFSVTKKNYPLSARFTVNRDDGTAYIVTRRFLKSFIRFSYTMSDLQGQPLGHAQPGFSARSLDIFDAQGELVGQLDLTGLPDRAWTRGFELFDGAGESVAEARLLEGTGGAQIANPLTKQPIASMKLAKTGAIDAKIGQDGVVPQQVLEFTAITMLDDMVRELFNLGILAGVLTIDLAFLAWLKST